ncbi:proton-coupled amino acid transporter-like protein CG1139 [Condylostylus longicornis]|uniref:proton-coupled amino acid transporter-like protein CG1139 n=1 Tax=Condylostylus longicornis TaxID=2530218 RepID=UPI00244E2A34|nr:proton-coupled amino acid transporter-like protein CG1139 [Condylostylus longicornis]
MDNIQKGYDNKGYETDIKNKDSNWHTVNLDSRNEKRQIASEGDDYDPYQHRDIKHPIRASEALIHLLKGSLGTGILAMPAAFKNSGYIVGIICTFIVGLICTYCVHVLLSTNYEQSKRKRVPHLTYPELAETALAGGPNFFKVFTPIIGHVTKIFLIIVQLGTSCVYVVFISDNIKNIVDYYTEKEDHIDIRLYMCMILLPLILINWVRNLKYLAPFTAIGNVATIVSFGVILYYIFREPISVVGRDAAAPIEKFPLYLGTVLFALEAIGVVIPLQNEMKSPKNFGRPIGVLNIAMFVIVSLYMGMGFCGYLKYGADIKGSITLNLAKDEVLAQSVKGMLAFSIYITHALQSYVAIDILWNHYIKKRLSSRFTFWEYVVRTCSTLVTFIFAIAIPNLELFISLVGALCLGVLGLALPATIQMSTYWFQTSGFARVRLIALNSFIFLVGIIGFIIGTTISIIEIIDSFSKPKTE